jgi:adenylosuccinate synthase
MIKGRFNVLLDQAWGSSGKGLMSTWLADHFNINHVSSANHPNAGHSAIIDDIKFVAKAIPTAAILKKAKGVDIKCFISPGSGFTWKQLCKEWIETEKPEIFIHSRASIVTEEHAKREREGAESTKHIASTMQGTATAIADKILRKKDVKLAGTLPLNEFIEHEFKSNSEFKIFSAYLDEFYEKVRIIDAMEFRNLTHSIIKSGNQWLHEGSQGYALSIDHGSHYPQSTSRNCSLQAAMDYMAIPPQMVGDVYLNLRSFPIRVGNVIEDGVQKGYSGDFYPDSKELTWEEVGKNAGMPEEEIQKLRERELTTVTKRLRRVATFSWIGLRDAVQTNGVTKICVNFIQYINWKDAGLKGGKEAFDRLSSESRSFISKVEEVSDLPVVLVGTGPRHEDIISIL